MRLKPMRVVGVLFEIRPVCETVAEQHMHDSAGKRGVGAGLQDQAHVGLFHGDAGLFDGYPDPAAMMGEALDATAGDARPAGRVVATHLGTGLADVVFGAAVLEAAAALGLGTVLPR